jgi:HK97 family phage portal protein
MWITELFKKKQFEPLDDKYLDALFRNLLRAGNLLEINDNAQSYIVDGYQGNADIYSIIRRHITMSTQAKLTLKQKMKDGSVEDVVDHELNKFLLVANPQMTMAEFREAYGVYLLATGDSFWYKPTLESGLNQGKTNEIYVLPANDIEIIQGNSKITAPVAGYKLISSTVPFKPEEVYHSKYFNPLIYTNETLFGQSPIMAAKDILSKQIQAAKTEAKQMENQGPAYLIFRKGQEMWNNLSDPQKTNLEKELNTVAKRGKQGGAMVMKDEFGIERLGLSPADLKIIESTQDGRRILCNVYMMPVALFNDPEGSTYNNVVEARKAAWTDALIPFNNKFTNDLNAALIAPVPEYVKGGYFYSMDYSDVEELQTGIGKKVDWMAKAKWTGNEIRVATGKDKVEEPGMDEPIFSQSDVLASELSLDTSLENKNHGDYK